jgi:type VI protein secretion system component VasK
MDMNANSDRQTPTGKRNSIRNQQVIAALNILEAEDSQMRTHLLDAAVAGAILARDPADRALRHEAAAAWQSLAETLSRHVAAEEEVTSPRAGLRQEFRSPVIKGVRERLARLRKLATAVASVDFDQAADAEVRRGARPLCAIAVDLDDLIDSDERQLFPFLQRSLFAHAARK